MTITCYKTASDPRVVSKTLTTIVTTSADPTGVIDVLSPSLELAYSNSLLSCNYVYIPDYHRYYYASAELLDGRRIVLNCRVDVLMSYSSGIRNARGVTTRSESVGSPTYIPDSKLPIHPSEVDVTAIRLEPSPFLSSPSGDTAVLSVLNVGGALA